MKSYFKMPFFSLKITIMSLMVIHCGKIDRGIDEFAAFREQAIYQINSSSQLIASGIGDVNHTLQELNDNIPKVLQQTLTFDVPYIIDEFAIETQKTALCMTDAASEKALYLLEVMKSELITGEPVLLPDPFICTTSSGTIDLNDANRTHRDVLEFVGPNLYYDRNFHAAIFTASGDSIPIETGRPDRYSIQASLINFDDNALTNYHHLAVYSEGDPIPMSSLFIVKKHYVPPVESTQKLNTLIAPVYPNLKVGDNNFSGNCLVTFQIGISNDTKNVWLEIKMFVNEVEHDSYASASSGKINLLHISANNVKIKRLEGGQTFWCHSFMDEDKGTDDNFDTPLGQITFKAKGEHAGAEMYGKISLQLNGLPVAITEVQN